MTVKAVFVFDDYWIDHTIQYITGSKWSHVAMWVSELDGYSGPIIIEAIKPGVVLQDGTKYGDINSNNIEFVEIEITDDQFIILKQKIFEYTQDKYKYDYKALIVDGICEKFGDSVKNQIAELLHCNDNHAMICSEIFTMLMRSFQPDFLSDKVPCTISPADIYSVLKR